MNKTPIITIIALLIVILIAFSGCEFEISLNDEENNTQTSIESVVVTDEEGSTQIETIVHYITTEPVPVVTIVEVTNEKGKVIETEKVTLSPEEVQDGKDFFNGKDNENETKKETELSKEPASDRLTTAPANDSTQKPVQDDFAILNSNRYMIEGRVVAKDGTTYPYKMARDGSRFTFRSVYEGEEMCLIMGSKYVYIVSPETKTYAKISKDIVKEESAESGEFDDLLSGDVFNLYANKKEVNTFTEKMYGVKYRVVEYDDGTYDYFNGKTLVQTVSKDGSILYYDSISTNVSEGLFVPPADYTEEIPTTAVATDNTSTTVCTDPNHNH